MDIIFNIIAVSVFKVVINIVIKIIILYVTLHVNSDGYNPSLSLTHSHITHTLPRTLAHDLRRAQFEPKGISE